MDDAPEGERRAHILRAATDHFGRRGYAAVSIGEIAAEVGITKAAIYHHFPSKHALYAAVMRETLGGIAAAIRGTSQQPGPATEKIRRLIEIALLRVPIDADMDSMMRDVEEHLPREERRTVALAEEAMWSALEDLMRAGVTSGELRRHDPKLMAYAFWQLLGGFVGRRVAASGFQGRPSVAEAVADLYLHGASEKASREPA